MKKNILYLLTLCLLLCQAITGLHAADTTYLYKNASVHVGNGKVITGGALEVRNGLIINVLDAVSAESAINSHAVFDKIDTVFYKVTDLGGKHIYPGIIACNTILGLSELDAVRATRDYHEVGQNNANISAVIAYNTDSRIIPTVLSNGILFAQVVPEGGYISGSSSVVTLSGWNWEDATYARDNGMHLHWPSMEYNAWNHQAADEQRKNTEKTIAEIRDFFMQAYHYCNQAKPASMNLKYEAMRGVFSGKSKLFIHADDAKSIATAITFAGEYKISMVLVGARDCFSLISLLKEKNIPVILSRTHNLPVREDDPVDQAYSLPAKLKKAGILFAISDVNAWEQRNVLFQAGTAAGYGLDREEALQSVTLDAAKILGIDKTTGSLEKGKEANFLICEGDLLDYRNSVVTKAFIRGKEAGLYNHQRALYEKFRNKYGQTD